MNDSEFLSPPPPPPPPVPEPFFKSKAKSNSVVLNTDHSSETLEIELEVALQRLLLSHRNFNIFYSRNSSLVPQLQDGPKCGLVALSIATSITKNFVKVNDIFDIAFAQGFTKQGEIFNANSLAILATKLGFEVSILDGGLNSHLSCILRKLLNRCLLLVPYDADFNHAPCCKGGSRAHWAIISGFVLTAEKSENEEHTDAIAIKSPECTACDKDQRGDQELYFSNFEDSTIIAKKRQSHGQTFKSGKVYLIGLQGKSKHIGLWSFDDMASSNNNLIHFPPSRDPEMYIVPEGGLTKGLKGKAIILEHESFR